jgi:hypothetical protein
MRPMQSPSPLVILVGVIGLGTVLASSLASQACFRCWSSDVVRWVHPTEGTWLKYCYSCERIEP